MIQAVIDTNVIVASALSRHADSATIRIMEAAYSGRIAPVMSEGILAEYRDVLSRAKIGLDAETQRYVISAMCDKGRWVMPMRFAGDIPDEDDREFFGAALAARAMGEAWLVTGNARHFPDEPFVVSPARFCEIAGI